jgi:mono/diheme cytochrome c family protein
MRIRFVTRATTAFATLLALACILHAWVASSRRPPDTGATAATPLDGSAAFEARCARCHAPSDADEYLEARGGGVRAAFGLEEFLAGHGGAGASERRAIVLWCVERPR